MKKYLSAAILFISLVSSIAQSAVHGPSVTGGADTCSHESYTYRCEVFAEGTKIPRFTTQVQVTENGFSPQLPYGIDISICDYDKKRRSASLRIEALSGKVFPSASSQINFDKNQKKISFLVSLTQDSNGSSLDVSNVLAECTKIQ